MCQPTIISQNIRRIGRRTFDRRMRIASPMYTETKGEIIRLLNDVDRLSEQLHEEFPTISADDYQVFGAELKILVDTLKALRKESVSRKELKACNERLRLQIADLEELDHDIRAFRVNALQNPLLKETMTNIGSLDFSRLAAKK